MGKSIHDLREMLCEELENLTEQRSSLTGDKLKAIDMLTHSIKSIDTIIAMEDSGYSRNDSYSRNDRGYSYARNRRYSRDDSMSKLEDMLHDASSEKEREIIRRLMERM